MRPLVKLLLPLVINTRVSLRVCYGLVYLSWFFMFGCTVMPSVASWCSKSPKIHYVHVSVRLENAHPNRGMFITAVFRGSAAPGLLQRQND